MNSNNNSHDPLVESALVDFDLAAEHHLANCQPCQGERERVEEALRQFAAVNLQYANRPERFWDQQAARIQAARLQAAHRHRMTMTLVPTVAVLLLLAFAILGRAPAERPVATSRPAVQTDPDHELLLRVERALQADTPLALEPATLMVEESDNDLRLQRTSERKGIRSHEN
jgi:hypothetical protein